MRDVCLLTCLEAAKRLNVSESTLYRYRRSGVIPEIILGTRTVRIRSDLIDAVIAGRARPATARAVQVVA